ncbi:MAG: PIG-L family deacetylase [Planctomycetaceae bacterium]
MNSPRILAIHAHPDDIEFQCAGTLALLKRRGCEIFMAVMTPGDCGSATLGPEEIADIRRQEALMSAELLGAEFHCLEFRDLCIVHDNDSRRRVTEILRRAQPDLVITAPPVDYMSDHEMTSRLVRDACFNAPIPNYSTHQWDPSPPLEQIPHLYFVDPIEGTDYFGNPVPPEFIIDISETFELKQQMLACHASQRDWLKKQHGIDEYLARSERWSASRGAEINASYGEAFRQYKGHPYPTSNRLLEMLEGE